jgi:hypothetical protein
MQFGNLLGSPEKAYSGLAESAAQFRGSDLVFEAPGIASVLPEFLRHESHEAA